MYSSLVSQSLYPLSDLPLTTLTMRNSIPNKTLEKMSTFFFLKKKDKEGTRREKGGQGSQNPDFICTDVISMVIFFRNRVMGGNLRCFPPHAFFPGRRWGGWGFNPACKIQRRRNNVDYGEKIITECSAFRCRLKFVLKCKTFLHKHTNAKCYVNYLTVLILPLTFQLT